MNFIDAILIIPLLWAAYKGFKKGLIIEIFSLLALFAGIYGGIHFSDLVADWLKDAVNIKEKYLPAVSFALTFIGVVVLVFYLGKMLEKVITMAAMKPLNKIAGAGFSLLKYGLILSIILGFLLPICKNLDILDQSSIEGSVLLEPVHDFALVVIPAIKESDFYTAMNGSKLEQLKDNFIDDVKERVPGN